MSLVYNFFGDTVYITVVIKPLSELSICLSVCLFCLSVAKMQKKFSQKLSNLDLWCLLTTYRKSHMGFPKNPSLGDP